MKKNEKTWLPMFSGFYNTIWEFDSENIVDDCYNTVPYNKMEIHHQDWEKDCCNHVISEINHQLSDFSLNMRFESISSPREYNFSNDSCNVVADVDEKAISTYIYENKSAFEDYLRKNYTSYDGFWSSFSNNFSDWEEDTKKFKDYSNNDHYLGAILQFICEEIGLNESDFRDSFNGYEECYTTLLPKTWEDVDVITAFEERIDELDLEYGDVIFHIEEAKRKAELFSTDWKEELSLEIKIELLESAGITAEEFDYA
jgi:hypothetical protein